MHHQTIDFFAQFAQDHSRRETVARAERLRIQRFAPVAAPPRSNGCSSMRSHTASRAAG